jgi:ABC-type polysaccharide/polyol phosphate transport system ATPase subunit
MVDLIFDRVSKRYRIRQDPQQTNSGRLARAWNRWRSKAQEFWALKEVSFEVERGEALGIIGHNGAGKSTILKLLSSITAPTSGEIIINGRLSALIEVGSGFHQELTGRENVYLNGSILGMRRREITQKLDSIIEFAGVEQFIDTPVKRYSSGMYLRLGFSIAAHLEAHILLLDEILAVGDAAFQAKCLQRVNELKRSGTTIVFISHNLDAVARLCDRTLLLQQGQIIRSGSSRNVIAAYEQMIADLRPSSPDEKTFGGSQKVEVISLTFYESGGRKSNAFHTGEPVKAELEFAAHDWVEDVVFEVHFYSIFGNLHCHFSTESSGEQINLPPGAGLIEFSCDEIGLEAATFNVHAIIKKRGAVSTEYIDRKYAAVLNVLMGKPVLGAFHMPHRWSIKHQAIADSPNYSSKDLKTASEVKIEGM